MDYNYPPKKIRIVIERLQSDSQSINSTTITLQDRGKHRRQRRNIEEARKILTFLRRQENENGKG